MQNIGEYFYGFGPVFKKELIHLRRNYMTLIIVSFFTILQMVFLGFAVNTNVRQIRTIVQDMSQTQESRRLIQGFVNTDDFNIVKTASSDEELYDAIVAGVARVGIKIPADYARNLAKGKEASILVLVDGSNSIVTTEALSATNGLMLKESIDRLVAKPGNNIAVSARAQVLFNPDTRTAVFIIPGLIVLQVQSLMLFMGSTAIASERQRQTLQQLYLTPANPLGVVLGKMLPYGIIALIQQTETLVLSYFLFNIKIQGSYLLLLLFTFPFLLLLLGIGLLISINSPTPEEAGQLAGTLEILTIFLSGFLFEVDSMPYFFQLLSKLIPATYYVEMTRAIIVRGAGFQHLWPKAAFMLVLGIIVTLLAAWQYQKQKI